MFGRPIDSVALAAAVINHSAIAAFHEPDFAAIRADHVIFLDRQIPDSNRVMHGPTPS